jgi:hypothetical protein
LVDILEDLYSPKIAAANVLLDLIKGRKKELLPKYLNFINKALTLYVENMILLLGIKLKKILL